MQKTIIQLAEKTPYKEIYTLYFLYTPISQTLRLNHGNDKYWIDEMFDKITDIGDGEVEITRFIRVHQSR